MVNKIRYGIAISEENLGDNAPVLFQSGLKSSMIKASQLGFDNVEIQIRNPGKIDLKDLLETVQQYNIKISAIGTGLEYSLNGLCFTSSDKNIREKTSIRFKEHIDLAAKLNAVVFLGLCRGKAPDYSSCDLYLNRLAAELIPIVSYARTKNVILALEPIVFYLTNLLNKTEETLEFLKRPGLENIQVLLDTHHMFIEDESMEKAFRMCQGRIAHVHISDSNRKYPGCGNVDYRVVGRTLRDIGYNRTVSLEVLPYPNGEEAASKGLKIMKEFI